MSTETRWHKHRVVRVRRLGPVDLFLRTPRLHTHCKAKVDRSPYPYKLCYEHTTKHSVCWYLSILSVLHYWTGLTLQLEECPEERRVRER